MKLSIIPGTFIAVALIMANNVQSNPLPLTPTFNEKGDEGIARAWSLADSMVKCLLKAQSDYKTNEASAKLLEKYYAIKSHPNNVASLHRTLSGLDSATIMVHDAKDNQKGSQSQQVHGYVLTKNDGTMPPGIYLPKKPTGPAPQPSDLAKTILNLSVIYVSQGRSTNTILMTRAGTGVHCDFVDSNQAGGAKNRDQHLLHMERDQSNEAQGWGEVRELCPQLLPTVPEITAFAGYECLSTKK